MTQLAVAVLGPDRPGVIAALTRILLADHGNLEDASMTLLRGQFAMTLIVGVDASAEATREALAGVAAELDLLVSVRETTPDHDGAAAASDPYVLRVHGADRPGLLHRMTELLASYQVNVTDLATRLIGSAAASVYVMVLSCDVPASADRPAVAHAVAVLADELAVEAAFVPVDSDLL